jgi:hypothetical protein
MRELKRLKRIVSNFKMYGKLYQIVPPFIPADV